jgi:hypothetical protein
MKNLYDVVQESWLPRSTQSGGCKGDWFRSSSRCDTQHRLEDNSSDSSSEHSSTFPHHPCVWNQPSPGGEVSEVWMLSRSPSEMSETFSEFLQRNFSSPALVVKQMALFLVVKMTTPTSSQEEEFRIEKDC